MATDLALNHTDLRKLNASFEGQLVTPVRHRSAAETRRVAGKTG